MSITGFPDGGPVRVGIPIADLTAGLFAAQGIFVALLEREASGKGQWLQTSLLQAQIFMLDFQSARWLVDSEVPPQAGNDHPTSIPTGAFATSDGSINLAIGGHPMWRKFCEILELDDLIDHKDYDSEAKRSANRDTLNAQISKVIEQKTTDEWVSILNETGVPCGPIYTIDQTFADPQVQHLAITESVHSELLGDMNFVGQPIKMTRTPSSLKAPSPGSGEHTDEILEELGFDAGQIADFHNRNVI